MAITRTQFVTATSEHIVTVKSWFSSYSEIFTWGGPELTYPIADKDFVALLQAAHLHSYALLDENGQLLAFGQHYLRLECHHLGRLVVNPQYRGQGLGQVLIKGLLERANEQNTANGASLFVFKDNLAAYHCYQNMGFVESPYPGGIPGNMPNCIYMVKPYLG